MWPRCTKREAQGRPCGKPIAFSAFQQLIVCSYGVRGGSEFSLGSAWAALCSFEPFALRQPRLAPSCKSTWNQRPPKGKRNDPG